jgi:hypothetical protein
MKTKLYMLALVILSLFASACKKAPLATADILKDREFSIEKYASDKTPNLGWRCSNTENFLQKDITAIGDRTLNINVFSDEFKSKFYGFRIVVYVNEIIKARRYTGIFPFDLTPLKIPAGATVKVQTYVEKLSADYIENDPSGNVSIKLNLE